MVRQLIPKYDIVINGGGIVGFTLLGLLAESPYLNRAKVLLIEQSKMARSAGQRLRVKTADNDTTPDSDNRKKSFSNRVSSITLKSKEAFRRLGVWDTVVSHSKSVNQIHVWNYDYDHRIEFLQSLSPGSMSQKEDRDVVFSILENDRLANAILEKIVDSGKSEAISWSSTLEGLSESLDGNSVDVTLTRDNGETSTIAGSLILGCDGYKSKVRRLTNMKYTEFDLKKEAVVGTVRMQPQVTNSENSIAYQRFSAEKDTVAALLPLDNEFCSFVISAPTDYANYLNDCSAESFTEEFNKLLTSEEQVPNIVLRGLHDVANAAYDGLKSMAQLARICPPDVSLGLQEKPCIDYLVENSRSKFPLVFGSTSPKMTSSLPGVDRTQIALLGDSTHRVHPLAGQGLNLGVQDAVELVEQLESIAKSGERIFCDMDLLASALKSYEVRRQAFIIPMSASILAMQEIFKLAPSRAISSFNKCEPGKKLCVQVANGCQ